MDLHARCQRGKPDVELWWETTSEEDSAPFTAGARENMHTSAPRKTTQGSYPSQTCPYICTHRCSDKFRPCGSSRQGEAQSSGPLPFAAAQQPQPGWHPGCCCCCTRSCCADRAQQPLSTGAGASHLSSCAGSSRCSVYAKATSGPNSTIFCGPNSGPAGNGLGPQPGAC